MSYVLASRFALGLAALSLVAAGCAGGSSSAGTGATGGSSATGGASATGGSGSGTGGTTGSGTGGSGAGGSVSTGGSTGQGGASSSGGTTGGGGVGAATFFTDDFESDTMGKQPAGFDNLIAYIFNNTSNPAGDGTEAVADNTHVHGGKMAVHFHGSANPALLQLK